MKVRYKGLARADLREISNYLHIRDHSDTLHRRFLASLNKTSSRLLQFPQIGRVEPGEQPGRGTKGELRRLALSRFPKYLIFYTVESDAVFNHRILYAARNSSLRLTDPS